MTCKDTGLSSFVIPRRQPSTTEYEVEASAREVSYILQAFRQSYLDQSYQERWKLSGATLVTNAALEAQYKAKRRQLLAPSLQETYAFACYSTRHAVQQVLKDGLQIRKGNFNYLGDSDKGVNVCRHADVQLKVAAGMKQAEIWIVMFKVMLGRKKHVIEQQSDVLLDPTPLYDSHIPQYEPNVDMSLEIQAIRSQVYVYEYGGDFLPVKRPRQVLPYAILHFQHPDRQQPAAAAAPSVRTGATVQRRAASSSMQQRRQQQQHVSRIGSAQHSNSNRPRTLLPTPQLQPRVSGLTHPPQAAPSIHQQQQVTVSTHQQQLTVPTHVATYHHEQQQRGTVPVHQHQHQATLPTHQHLTVPTHQQQMTVPRNHQQQGPTYQQRPTITVPLHHPQQQQPVAQPQQPAVPSQHHHQLTVCPSDQFGEVVPLSGGICVQQDNPSMGTSGLSAVQHNERTTATSSGQVQNTQMVSQTVCTPVAHQGSIPVSTSTTGPVLPLMSIPTQATIDLLGTSPPVTTSSLVLESAFYTDIAGRVKSLRRKASRYTSSPGDTATNISRMQETFCVGKKTSPRSCRSSDKAVADGPDSQDSSVPRRGMRLPTVVAPGKAVSEITGHTTPTTCTGSCSQSTVTSPSTATSPHPTCTTAITSSHDTTTPSLTGQPAEDNIPSPPNKTPEVTPLKLRRRYKTSSKKLPVREQMTPSKKLPAREQTTPSKKLPAREQTTPSKKLPVWEQMTSCSDDSDGELPDVLPVEGVEELQPPVTHNTLQTESSKKPIMHRYSKAEHDFVRVVQEIPRITLNEDGELEVHMTQLFITKRISKHKVQTSAKKLTSKTKKKKVPTATLR